MQAFGSASSIDDYQSFLRISSANFSGNKHKISSVLAFDLV